MAEEQEPTRLPKSIRAYEVSKLLGRGGMGEVFLAKHDLLDREVAIKRYAPAQGAKTDKKSKERFLREGKALAWLNHHGIIGIHDLFEHRGQLCMVLEYVDGCHVGDLVKKGPLPLDVACIIGVKVAEALEHAHFHGIIHRDIKATNVMVSRGGEIKLMDFGIARGELLEKITQTGLLVGTPMYLAPEVIAGGEPTPQSDIYGMGALLYQCLSGKRLYYHTKQENLYHHIMAGKYVRLNKITRGVPRQLRSIVDRCLALKPERRHRSMAALRRALDLFMASERMWLNPAERLVQFRQASSDESDAYMPISVDGEDTGASGVVVHPAPSYRRRRWLRLALFGLGCAALGAAVLLLIIRLGWLDPFLGLLGR